MKLLVERLAIPLSNQKTVAKWLVIANRLSQQAGKSLVIAMTTCSGLSRRLRLCHAAAETLLQWQGILGSRSCTNIVDTSVIHDTLAVIANKVKQSSKTKKHCRHCE
ncbi:MAG: hypothetical protein ACYCY7_12850 [Gallionella sp.]